MNGIFDLPARLINGVKVSASYINKLLDAIRRRTIIAGNGIITQSTPNGTVVSVTRGGKGRGVGLVTESGDVPWRVRYKNGQYQVYIPYGALSIRYRKSVSTDYYKTMAESLSGLLNTASDETGWYNFATLIPTLSEEVVCYIFEDLSYGVAFEGYGNFISNSPILATFPVAVINRTGTKHIEQIAYGSYMADITSPPPKYGTEITLSPTNATTLTDAIAAASGGSGEGSDLVPSSATPQVDAESGNAGTSEAYSRGDHAHPLNVDGTIPAKISTEKIESEVGTSGKYARVDHVHGADFMANSESSGVGVEVMKPDGGEEGVATIGENFKAAPIDHAHPLNVDETGDEVGIEITPLAEGDPSDVDFAGISLKYARADHTHPIYNVAPLAVNGVGDVTPESVLPDGTEDGAGEIGEGLNYAAPINHRHPINCESEATNIKAAEKDGSAGTLKTYARTDHVHPIPSPAIDGISGILGFPVQTTIPNGNSQEPNEQALTGFNTVWERDSASVNGFTISVLCRLTRNSSGQVVGWFRNLTFDKFGAVRNVSAVTVGEVLETY